MCIRDRSCIIIGGGLEVAEEGKKLAEKRDCVIITTPFDTFSVARLINQSKMCIRDSIHTAGRSG